MQRQDSKQSPGSHARTGMVMETSGGKKERSNLEVQKSPDISLRCLFSEAALPSVNFTLIHTQTKNNQ